MNPSALYVAMESVWWENVTLKLHLKGWFNSVLAYNDGKDKIIAT